MGGMVTAVGRSATHTFGEAREESIRLLAGLGVEGDAHMGETIRHRSRVARDPIRPDLRQIHLIQAKPHDELVASGFDVSAGQIGENVTTRGVDLPGMPKGARLLSGDKAGIMAIVLEGGEVRPGDPIRVGLPSGPRRPLERV